jgi:tRNA (guanine10-N2)-dimethyltransferase
MARGGPPPGVYVLELGGEEDAFAAREAESACAGVAVVAPGIARAGALSTRVAGLAYTRTAAEAVGFCDPTVEGAVACLDAATLDREGSIAVRARDVRGLSGVSTGRAERELGAVLVERGFSVDLDDPDHVLRVLFSEEKAALGWLTVETRRDFSARKPTDKPFFQPGSMDPMDARALANIAGARPGATILDPMCGTGGVLVEAGLVGARVVGNDAQWKMVRGAHENLAHYLDGGFAVLRGDATRLALRDGSVDGVVFDAPYGRQSKIANESLDALVGEALAESRRVVREDGLAVVVGDRSWAEAAEEAGWTVESSFARRVHRSLTRYVLVLS